MLDGVERRKTVAEVDGQCECRHDGLSEDETQNWVVWKNIDSR